MFCEDREHGLVIDSNGNLRLWRHKRRRLKWRICPFVKTRTVAVKFPLSSNSSQSRKDHPTLGENHSWRHERWRKRNATKAGINTNTLEWKWFKKGFYHWRSEAICGNLWQSVVKNCWHHECLKAYSPIFLSCGLAENQGQSDFSRKTVCEDTNGGSGRSKKKPVL